jgi:hypothetical protein
MKEGSRGKAEKFLLQSAPPKETPRQAQDLPLGLGRFGKHADLLILLHHKYMNFGSLGFAVKVSPAVVLLGGGSALPPELVVYHDNSQRA